MTEWLFCRFIVCESSAPKIESGQKYGLATTPQLASLGPNPTEGVTLNVQ